MMEVMATSRAQPAQNRVAVVTGGGGGIGTAAALQLARQGTTVVVVDPGVGVQGEPLHEPSAEQTANLIEKEGGRAEASTVSVTDPDGLASLFRRVVDDYGSLDAVVNTAGFLRFSNTLDASEDDWTAVLDVHFNGYINVLRAALPYMVAAGSGRIVGFTSGVGLARTMASGSAYGCAKRAVASLTWQMGRLVPDGICINALSPIAASRMVRSTMVAGGANPRGLDLSAMPQPDDMGPAAAYLASEKLGWSRGQIIFSGGSELTLIGPPQLLEAVRTQAAADFSCVLDTVVPVVLAPAEASQVTTGGTNPRFGAIFDELPGRRGLADVASSRGHCLIVADDPRLAENIDAALAGWGMSSLGVGSWKPFDRMAATIPTEFATAAETVERAARTVDRLEGLVVALGTMTGSSSSGTGWEHLLDAHAGTTRHIVAHAAWIRAGLLTSTHTGQPLRSVQLTRATSPAGRTAAQAIAQMARCTNDTPTPTGTSAFAIAVESGDRADQLPMAALVARLVAADDTPAIKGGEIVVRPGWVGLRSHPGPVSTISFGGPEIPDWVDEALREAAAGGGY